MAMTVEEKRAYQKAWRNSPEGKAKLKAYNNSPERKEYLKTYENSEEYKARKKVYRSTPEYKEHSKVYTQSNEYKARKKVYRNTREVKIRREAYLNSPDGKAKREVRNNSPENRAKIEAYGNSPEGKAIRVAYRNSLEGKAQKNSHMKNRYAADPLFKSMITARGIVRRAFSLVGTKKSLRSESVLGCTFSEFHSYIQSKFWPGMTDDNHGYSGWVVDHIVPVASGTTPEEILQLSHYTNLQPLWNDDNTIKSDRLDWTPNESLHERAVNENP